MSEHLLDAPRSTPLAATMPGFHAGRPPRNKGCATRRTRRRLVGAEEEFDPDNPAENPAVAKVSVTIPDRSKLGRFATFDSDYPPGTDLDVFVYKDGRLVGASAGGSAEERVTVTQPGTYNVYVVQYSLAAELTEQDVQLHSCTSRLVNSTST